MIDVKKFVVAFLVLAALASSSAFVLFGSGGTTGSVSADQQPFTAQTTGSPNAFPKTAFAQPSTPADPQAQSGAAAAAIRSDPNNLTDQLAGSLLNNLMAANPKGPRDAGDGAHQIVTTPDAQTVLASLNTSTALKSLEVPDWDFEAAKFTARIATNTSATDVAQYGNALNSVLNTYFVKTNLQTLVNNTGAGPDNLPYIASQIQGALNDAGALAAPKDLAEFHKSLIKLLVYEKNALALAGSASNSNDPARAALVFQAQNEKYQQAIADFQKAWGRALENKAFSSALLKKNDAGIFGLLNNIFGIPTAHALFGLGDIVFDPSIFARMVWEFVQSMLLQILKNTLITLLQNKVLALIRNAGNPRFIQNWSGLLYNAFNMAAGSALGEIIPGLCGHFRTNVTSWLKNVYTTANITPGGVLLNGATASNCTLNTVVNNIPGYYGNFSVGGWNGFGALLTPNNNPFGAFIEARDQVTAVANAARTAAQNKSTAGSGFPGQPLCDDGSEPNPGDGNLCDDGTEPFIVTPGNSFADTLGRNLNSSIDLVVNANNITGILATVTSALLQQLINSGVNGLVGAPRAGTGAAPTPAPTPIRVSCIGSPNLASTTQQIFFAATGGTTQNYTWNAPGGNPATGSGVSFTTTYFFPGVHTATVTNIDPAAGNTTANCSVSVQ